METVTVVMSTYNGEKYLCEQIDSILTQSGCEVYLLVRDDGSTDGTIALLKRYEEARKLKFYQGENLKPARSFLEALYHAGDTDYYAFADQDDVWYPRKLITAIQQLEQQDNSMPNMYCSNLTAVNAKNEIININILPQNISTDYRELLVRSSYIFGCTMVFNHTLKKYITNRTMPQYLIMHDLWIALIASAFGVVLYDFLSYKTTLEQH